MKKTIALLLCLCMLTCLFVGCASTSTTEQQTSETTTTTTTTTETKDDKDSKKDSDKSDKKDGKSDKSDSSSDTGSSVAATVKKSAAAPSQESGFNPLAIVGVAAGVIGLAVIGVFVLTKRR